MTSKSSKRPTSSTTGIKGSIQPPTSSTISSSSSSSPSPSPSSSLRHILVNLAILIGAIALFLGSKEKPNDQKSTSTQQITTIKASESVFNKFIPISPSSPDGNATCAYDFISSSYIPQCHPPNTGKCGRYVHDNFLSVTETKVLKEIAEIMFKYSQGDSGPMIFDLVSGALTFQEQFIQIYQFAKGKKNCLLTGKHVKVLEDVTNRIRAKVLETFLPTISDSESPLMLTHPFFFSKIMANRPAKTVNDEYWHEHVDQKQYKSFVYTALIYLADFGSDFDGGEFVFLDAKGNDSVVIEPKTGRLNLFTSGYENVHRVNKVTKGTRLAMTLAFTCQNEDKSNPMAIDLKQVMQKNLDEDCLLAE